MMFNCFTSEIYEFWQKNASHVTNHGKSRKSQKFMAWDAKNSRFPWIPWICYFGLDMYMMPQ